MDPWIIGYLAFVAGLYIPLLAYCWWLKRRERKAPCPHQAPENWGRQ